MLSRFLRGGSKCPIQIGKPPVPLPPLTPCREVCHLSMTSRLKLRMLQVISGLQQRYCLWRLRRLLGVAFDETGFQEGTRQATATMMEAVRHSNWVCIRKCCTERASVDIYGLAQGQGSQRSVGDLMRFQSQHLKHAIPQRVSRECIDGQCCVLVDMLFIGLRNLVDFETQKEQAEFFERLQNMLSELQAKRISEPIQGCLVAAEVGLTFCKKLRKLEEDSEDLFQNPDKNGDDDGWLIDAYKMHHLKLISFCPQARSFRVFEFLKPV
ncbi:uncharacterized protein LOC110177969 [Drosophila serrata]|uniref:uncharacterized protein LOC110177969 n=1 Tax=Drosophila serrata TaxID=7274 RepID=UPI000A1D05EF|nr:uncharacterized protein LOC110177969 [Drosophila serrata]